MEYFGNQAALARACMASSTAAPAATFLIGDLTDAGAGALRLELAFDATLTADGREGAGGTTWCRLIVDRGVDKATAISNSKYGAARLLT